MIKDAASQLASVDLTALWIAAAIIVFFFIMLLIVATIPSLNTLFREGPETVISSRRMCFLLLILTECVGLLYLILSTKKLPDLPPVLCMLMLFLVGAIAAPQIIDLLKGKIGIPEGPNK